MLSTHTYCVHCGLVLEGDQEEKDKMCYRCFNIYGKKPIHWYCNEDGAKLDMVIGGKLVCPNHPF